MIRRLLVLAALLRTSSPGQDPAGLVDPFTGTGGHGHTFPGATVPFGMVQLSPDTRVEGWDACGGYYHEDSSILGFSHTHLSGTGVADYGDILVAPTAGELRIRPGDPGVPRSGYRSRYSHLNEEASPGYYRVRLEDDGILAELTATTRVGVHRYTFPGGGAANLLFDLRHGLGPDSVVESEVEIIGSDGVAGYRRSAGWAKDQRIYFAARFSVPFDAFGIVLDDSLFPGERTSFGRNLKAFVRYLGGAPLTLVAKVGLSSVSIEGARRNLEAEMPGWDFDAVRAGARRSWNDELGKIEVEGGTDDDRRTFTTALYHVMIAPNVFSDVDGQYRGMDGTIRRADGFTMYTVFSLWDTYRAEHPLLTIIDRKRTVDFARSLLAKYDESGMLPIWELATNETWCMIGYHAVPVLVDAWMKQIRDFDGEGAFAAMVHSATMDHLGLPAYRRFGCIPGELEPESVSKTLEYAYDDWCIARMAAALGKPAEQKLFDERAQYYKNLFQPQTRFLRPRVNNMWAEPFDPASVTFHYTEANPWQYRFAVPHDVTGLIGNFGGRERFGAALDSLFAAPAVLAGRQQADISGLIGQYAQGNEPSHHVAYLYTYAGQAWKTQRTVRLIMDSLYHAGPAGLCGNDDCGQMSAWYVMSALGFYQVAPGDPVYVLGSPLFPRATVHLENGRRFVIEAAGNSRENMFIRSAAMNGAEYRRSFFTHEDIMNGARLTLTMGPEPDPAWGAGEGNEPRSLPFPPFVSTPSFAAASNVFRQSLEIAVTPTSPGSAVYYTLDGSEPGPGSPQARNPVTIEATTTVKAVAVSTADPSLRSKVVSGDFRKTVPVGTVVLRSRYSAQYTGGGDSALIDGQRGSTDFRLGTWQGYEGNDLDAVVDLGAVKEVHRVALGCLQDNNSWIFFPVKVEVSFSSDGERFDGTVTVNNDIDPGRGGASIMEYEAKVPAVRARYIRVHAVNLGTCPPWHKGAGQKAWLFADEILVD